MYIAQISIELIGILGRGRVYEIPLLLLEDRFAFYEGVGAGCCFDDLAPAVVGSVVAVLVVVVVIVGGAVSGDDVFDEGVGHFFEVEERQSFGVGCFCECEVAYIIFDEVVEYCGGGCFYGHFGNRSSRQSSKDVFRLFLLLLDIFLCRCKGCHKG